MPSMMSSPSARRRRAVDDELADQAVVVGRDPVAVVERGVDADAEAAGRVVLRDAAGGGGEARQFLGVEAHLDGVAVDLEVLLPELHGEPGGHADLFTDEVDAEDAFGHRVFDLQAGVHLDEVELAVLVEELDGPRADVVDGGDGVRADLADAGAGGGVDRGAGGFLEHLLVAALERAVPFAQMHRIPLAVAEDLDLDMAGVAEVLLDCRGTSRDRPRRCRRRPSPRSARCGRRSRVPSRSARASCRARRRRRSP